MSDDEDRIERAASGRSRCKGCGVAIDKDELRFAARNLEIPMLPAVFYHLRCARDTMPERFAAVAAQLDLPEDALPPPPDAGLAMIMSVERSPSGRARCQHCKTAIAEGGLRVIVRTALDPEEASRLASEGYPTYREGFIHIGCAAALTKNADGLDDYLVKRATKKVNDAVAGYVRARALLAKEPDLVGAGDASVVGDWLEEKHAIIVAGADLAQLLGTPVSKSARPTKTGKANTAVSTKTKVKPRAPNTKKTRKAK